MEILFGKPSFEYPLIKENAIAALFVPLTIVVWENDNGVVSVSYWDPQTNILPLLNIKGKEALSNIKDTSSTINKIVEKAIAIPDEEGE